MVFPNNYGIFFIYHEYKWSKGYYSDEGTYVSTTEAKSLINYDTIRLSDLNNVPKFYLLLPWYYKKKNLYYIIRFSKVDVYINELHSGRNVYRLECRESIYGFITHKDNDSKSNDYLNVFSKSIIYIYNLEYDNLFKKFDIYLFHPKKSIQWNDRYMIFIDGDFSLKILDLKIYKIITVIRTYNCDEDDYLVDIKKIKHPIYGESLLTSGKGINLWTT